MSAKRLLLLTVVSALVLLDCFCADPDVCFLPKETGPCRAAMERYFFSCETGRCEKFTYGGCRGNGNNFKTLEDCYNACQLCRMPKNVGPCRAYFPRYYYDAQTRKCKRFIYGGCQSNKNNFRCLNDCKRKCGGTLPCNGI